MDKIILNNKEVRQRILDGIDFIVNPVSSTIGPRGNNVMVASDNGFAILTNDGVTVAKNISAKDQIHQIVIDVIKEAALKTNSEGGDGTTSTTLLSGILAKEAMRLVDSGHSWIHVRDTLFALKDKLIARIEKSRIVVDGKKGLKDIATISANNDPVIAENVMKAINVAGETGMVFLEGNNKQETELIEDLGFMVKSGVMYQELFTDAGRSAVMFKDTPVLITDKRLYYSEEAETILRTAVKAKYKTIVIVARDFIGEALNTFIANHQQGVIKVMLVKADEVTDTNNEILQDLAVYVGGDVLSERKGSLVNKITDASFVIVNQVYSDPSKTLFTPKTAGGKKLKERIQSLQEELKKKDDTDIKNRIASLTTGVVTIKVGGSTPIEIREKVYRYEDAVNAVRSAMKHGYVAGGGTALLKAYNESDCTDKDFIPLYRRFCESIVRKIAENSGQHEDTVVKNVLANKSPTHGYNAKTDTYEDMIKAGVVDPFMVVKLAIENSVSVANILNSVNYYVINDLQNDIEED